MAGYRVGRSGPDYYACPRHRRGNGQIRCTTANLRVSALDDFSLRLLGQIGLLPEIVEGFVGLAKEAEQGGQQLRREMSLVTAALEGAKATKRRVKEEIKAALSRESAREWREELEKSLVEEDALKLELAAVTEKLRDDGRDGQIRQQIVAALGNGKAFVESLPQEGRDQFLRAALRRILVNAPDNKKASSEPNTLTFEPPDEKGRYVLNVEFIASGLAPMLYKHCAENSTNLGKWLPGLGSNQRPSD